MEPGTGFIEQGMQSLSAAKTESEGHRTVVTEHKPGRAMHPFDPIGELPGIGHGGRQGH